MHEFTSISVSSYDAASLADKLTEKSAAGWDVVAIVPAGTNITAYLNREAEDVETAPSWDTGSDDAASAAAYGAAEPAAIADSTPADVGQEIQEPAVEEPAPVWEPEPVAEEPPPVTEPAGWAVAPEPVSPPAASVGVVEVSPEPAPYADTSSGYSASQAAETAETGYVGEPRLGSSTAGYDTGATGYDTGTSSGAATTPSTGEDAGAATTPSTGYDAGAATTPSTGYDAGAATETATTSGHDSEAPADAATGYDAGVTAESATVASSESSSSAAAEQTAATAASAAPAGWYADPSGRYELRYWDGTQWTEHVSRAGQQYTDPPVA